MRVTWPDGTSLEVNFYSKGDSKSQVSVQHSKLKDSADVARRKAYWSAALARLKDFLK